MAKPKAPQPKPASSGGAGGHNKPDEGDDSNLIFIALALVGVLSAAFFYWLVRSSTYQPRESGGVAGLRTLATGRGDGAGAAAFALGKCAETGAAPHGGVNHTCTLDSREAVRWYEAAVAADATPIEAWGALGRMVEVGAGGKKADPREAARLYQVGADEGDPDAQYWLGVALQTGGGVPKDDRKSASWFKAAADAGHALAQHAYGHALATGLGVRQDAAGGVAYWRRAAEQGVVDSTFNLAMAYRDGTGVARSEAESRKWMNKAAALGDKDAQRMLGG